MSVNLLYGPKGNGIRKFRLIVPEFYVVFNFSISVLVVLNLGHRPFVMGNLDLLI